MAYATAGTVIADYILGILTTNKVTLGLVDIWLGEQKLLPTTPCACVILGPTKVELVGTPRRVENTYDLTVQIYHSSLMDKQSLERECNQRAEAVQTFLNADPTMSGNVIHSYVTGVEPGFASRGDSWYKSSRVSWTGFSRFNL